VFRNVPRRPDDVEGMPRYWGYLVAALVGLGAGAIFRGTIGIIIGVLVALTIILLIESRTRRARRR
jgi:4-amino-4-deoxy-L-arabinose transferase-like glycosyltransferase